MEITTHSIIIWITAVIIGSLSLVIFMGSKRLSSRAFAFSIFWVMVWSLVVGLIPTATTAQVGSLYLKLSFLLGEITAACFFFLCLTFPEDIRPKKITIILLVISQLTIIFCLLKTNLIIRPAFPIQTPLKWGQSYGPLWFIFDLAFFGFSTFGMVLLYKKIRLASDSLSKTHLRFMLATMLVGFIPPSLTTIILPRLGYYDLAWLGPVTGLIWAGVVAYSILKYRQMNVRVFAAEVITISMGILTFTNIFTDFSFGVYGRTFSFLVFFLLGYLLIRNIRRVSTQKEELDTLNTELQKKVEEQTKERKRAYEVEKRANAELKGIDRNKNDFIIITQHHLRTPLNQVRWYATSVLSGLYGNLSPELAEVVSKIDITCGKLTKTLNNFIDIVQLKIETKVLEIRPSDIKNIFETLLQERSDDIRKYNLTINLSGNDSDWPVIQADEGRFKDALAIIIDNAILYNEHGGRINIKSKVGSTIFAIEIQNTGIILTDDERQRLFKQSFFRSRRAKEVNPMGMGVGLLVAKTIIAAHGGKIKVENTNIINSFVIEMPILKII